jgi:hypothetical protein
MENSAVELEKEVKERTIELIEERKKADILLYKIMTRLDKKCVYKKGKTFPLIFMLKFLKCFFFLFDLLFKNF